MDRPTDITGLMTKAMALMIPRESTFPGSIYIYHTWPWVSRTSANLRGAPVPDAPPTPMTNPAAASTLISTSTKPPCEPHHHELHIRGVRWHWMLVYIDVQ